MISITTNNSNANDPIIKNKTGRIKPWSVIFWIMVWALAALRMENTVLLVSPFSALKTLWDMMRTVQFYRSVAFSMGRIMSGFALGCVCGVILAALSARFEPVNDLVRPIMLVIRSTPVASFIILALIWFASKNLSVFISFLMVLPVIFTNAYTGIVQTDRELLEMAKVFEISGGKKLRYIYLPKVLPYLRSACTIALGMSWKSGIAAEVIGIPRGSIGEGLQQAKVYLNTSEVFAWTVTIIVLSVCFEKLVLWLLGKLSDRLIA